MEFKLYNRCVHQHNDIQAKYVSIGCTSWKYDAVDRQASATQSCWSSWVCSDVQSAALLDARPRSPTHRDDDDDDDDARFQCKFSRGGGGGHVARAALLTTERVNVRRATVAVSVGGGSVR